MATAELGSKQLCPNCQTKFYDLGRRPAHCPKCATDFDPEEAVRSRRVRARSTPADYEQEEVASKPARDEDQEGFEEEVEATPEIDEAADADPIDTGDDEADEGGVAAPAGGDDLGVDFEEEDAAEEADDVPFLEDEDDGLGEDDIAIPDDEDKPDR